MDLGYREGWGLVYFWVSLLVFVLFSALLVGLVGGIGLNCGIYGSGGGGLGWWCGLKKKMNKIWKFGFCCVLFFLISFKVN